MVGLNLLPTAKDEGSGISTKELTKTISLFFIPAIQMCHLHKLRMGGFWKKESIWVQTLLQTVYAHC